VVPFLLPSFRLYLRRWNPFTWRQPESVPVTERRQALAVASQSDSLPSSLIERLLDFVAIKRSFKGLEKAQARIENGDNEWESLAKEKVISEREAEALAMASSGQTRAWLLNWSATKQQSRWAARIDNRTRAIVTVVNIGLVVIVALAAVAVFSTLTAIMEFMH
jgi:hypothetical protein